MTTKEIADTIDFEGFDSVTQADGTVRVDHKGLCLIPQGEGWEYQLEARLYNQRGPLDSLQQLEGLLEEIAFHE